MAFANMKYCRLQLQIDILSFDFLFYIVLQPMQFSTDLLNCSLDLWEQATNCANVNWVLQLLILWLMWECWLTVMCIFSMYNRINTIRDVWRYKLSLHFQGVTLRKRYLKTSLFKCFVVKARAVSDYRALVICVSADNNICPVVISVNTKTCKIVRFLLIFVNGI